MLYIQVYRFIQKYIVCYMLKQVHKSLLEITKDIVGAKVENNKFCVSVHYRNVDEKVIWFLLLGCMTN